MKKQNIDHTKKVYDRIIILVFIFSMIVPIMVSETQQYIVQYGDDVSVINWAKEHSLFDIFTSKLGTGYRPMMNLLYIVGYTLWGSEAKYYYLFSGILFSGGMVFLYLLGKILHSRLAGIVAVLLYLLLDSSFILVSKINFIVTTGEIFFITSSIFFFVNYYISKNSNSIYISIILSIFAFLTKEPSILIIPTFILTYLYLNKDLNKKYIMICIIPFIYVFLEMMFISPDIGSGNTSIFQRIFSNILFYYDTEISSQFKTPLLLLFSILAASFFVSYSNLKNEIILCFVWFLSGIFPFIVTQQPVQPTYLAEANLGIVLLIGIVISQSLKNINYITVLLVIGIIFQTMIIPFQIENMQNYNRMISDNQNTFLETVTELNQVPSEEIIYYIPESVREKYGGYQITEDFFRQYLNIKNIERKITTNYEEAKYIILPSSLDIQIFQKEYPEEIQLEILNKIQHNNDYGLILRKI